MALTENVGVCAVKQVLSYMDKDNNWHQLVMSLWTDTDPGVRNRMFENLIINGCLLGYQRQKANKEKYNCNIPGPSSWIPPVHAT